MTAANAVSLASRLYHDTISEISDNDIDLEVQEDVTMRHESEASAKKSHRSAENRIKDETRRSFVTLPYKASKTPRGESKANINFWAK